MRIVTIGAGSVARRHADVLAGLGAHLVGVVDPHPVAATELASAYGASRYDTVEDALDGGRPHAVYICVPPFAHGAAERAVLARGLPFFVEKPLGVDLTEPEELGRLVEEAGVVTGTGYHWRCLEHLPSVQERIAGAPPLLAVGSWLDKRPPVAWWGSSRLSGGQVVEQLTHLLDLARLLFGEATEVHALGARRTVSPGDGRGLDALVDAVEDPVDDATVATVRFASGVVASFTATSLLTTRGRTSLQVVGPGWSVDVDETGATWDRAGSTGSTEPGEDPRVTVDREFLEAVRGERAGTRAPYSEALRTHRLGCAIAESARTGRPVPVATEPSGPGR